MSNSPLATYRRISPNRSAPRNHKIDTVTIHCFVGQVTAQQGCNARVFVNPDPRNGASCNYVVGRDGSIGLCVEEKDRSWCSSSRANDNRAITIEVASGTSHPYAVTDAAYNALLDLLTDICQRNGIPELKWKADPSLIGHPEQQNMTVHRWFAQKACPGEYLYSRHGAIAAEVNKRLEQQKSTGRWMQDKRGWYYLQENGKKLTSQWLKDSKDWVYVGPDGYVYTNAWVKDTHGWCFVKDDGRLLRDGWAYDSKGAHYIDHDGHMKV